MRYMLLMHYSESDGREVDEEATAAAKVAFASYAATLQAAGVLITAEVLRPSDITTTVSMASAKVAGVRIPGWSISVAVSICSGSLVIVLRSPFIFVSDRVY